MFTILALLSKIESYLCNKKRHNPIKKLPLTRMQFKNKCLKPKSPLSLLEKNFLNIFIC